MVIPDYRHRAEEKLYEMIETCEMEERTEIVLEGEFSIDGECYIFCFGIVPEALSEKEGVIVLTYEGCH